MIQRYLLLCACLLTAGMAHADLQVHPASVIQDLIDSANPGDEITIPSGIYEGSLTIKDTIILRGAGDSSTIIDGKGAAEVVVFGKEAMLIGFTVRNGQVLATSKGNFIGIFECTFEGFERFGIFFEAGSGVVANNIIRGSEQSVGIFCYSANPLILHNVIEGCRYGFRWLGHLIPTLINNLFRNNILAIYGPEDGQIILERNLFDGNRDVYNLGALPEGNEIRSVAASEFILQRGTDTGSYRDLMDKSYESAVKDHPIIVYDLHQEPSVFDAITLFPWASFVVSASTIDTIIEDYEAYDWVEDRKLNAEFVKQSDQRPSVRVNNPEIVEKMRERFVLENRYVHPGSYYDDADGRRVFKRMTNVSQIEVVIPEGYRVISFSPDAILYDNEGRRPYLSMQDIGNTYIEVVLERISAR